MDQNVGNDPLSRGMRELLYLLPEETLKNLLGTVTGYLVRYGSVPVDENGSPTMDPKTHAIQTCLMYSEPYDLLGRQKMTRAVLSDYLNKKSVRMTMPATKKSLCQDILRHWGVQSPDNLTIREVERPPEREEIKSGKKGDTLIFSPSQANQKGTFLHTDTPQQQQSSQPAQTQNQSSPVSIENGYGNTTSSLVPVSNQEVERMEYENVVAIRKQEAQLGLQLGNEFSRWFYERLNTLTDFTASHFWPECNLRMEMILTAFGENALIDEVMGNGEICCAKIKDLVAVKQLYFNPNTLGSGIRGYLSPHGLAQVMVCGTLHQKETGAAVGVFEQMFGLMKDPRFGNNYKIKFTVLRLREGSHLAVQDSPPELCDSSLVGIIEEVDDD